MKKKKKNDKKRRDKKKLKKKEHVILCILPFPVEHGVKRQTTTWTLQEKFLKNCGTWEWV